MAKRCKLRIELRQINCDDIITGNTKIIARTHDTVQVQAERCNGVYFVSAVGNFKKLIVCGFDEWTDVGGGACKKWVRDLAGWLELEEGSNCGTWQRDFHLESRITIVAILIHSNLWCDN